MYRYRNGISLSICLPMGRVSFGTLLHLLLPTPSSGVVCKIYSRSSWKNKWYAVNGRGGFCFVGIEVTASNFVVIIRMVLIEYCIVVGSLYRPYLTVRFCFLPHWNMGHQLHSTLQCLSYLSYEWQDCRTQARAEVFYRYNHIWLTFVAPKTLS